MRAKVISFINLKGGVSKTTTCVGTALALSEHYKKKVLVIDMDPQTNASTMLLGEKRWEELDRQAFFIKRSFFFFLQHGEVWGASNHLLQPDTTATDLARQ